MSGPPVDRVETSVFTVPTEEPESDGTFTWTSTTVVVVEPLAGGARGLGFTYGSPACATVVADTLAEVVTGSDASDPVAAYHRMSRAVRNIGRPGIAASAISAVDTALWDLRAKLEERPLVDVLGRLHENVACYGSGGFTSYTDDELATQLAGWVEAGIPRVKMKVGTAWGSAEARDIDRVRAAREAIGPGAELFVDANGGFARKQAVRFARQVEELGVVWFEEPVSSDDLEGLHEIRGLVACDVAAGEYGYALPYFQRMCSSGAVDVLQADASRCGGFTEWIRVAAVAAAHDLEISGHCAQSLHAHVACCVPNVRHLEYFHDHARVDRTLFDGVLAPSGGVLTPDRDRLGLGLELKHADAERYLRAQR